MKSESLAGLNRNSHADAGKVGVMLKTTPDGVVLIIEDDGKGFESEAVNR